MVVRRQPRHRRAFLKKMAPDAAWASLAARLDWPDPRPEHVIPVEHALGRVTPRALEARTSSPPGPVAAMDGIAVASGDTADASETRPVVLTVRGTEAEGAQGRPGCLVIDTGDPLPPGTDAVVMIEHAAEVAPGAFEIQASVPPWRNVRLLGEDVVQGDVVVPRGKVLGPYDLGALLAVGWTHLPVVRRPRVGLLPTGDELIEPGDRAVPGAVIEFNSRIFAALLAEWGAESTRFPPSPDVHDALVSAIRGGLASCDALVVNAGSSAGRDDWTAEILEELGELVAHGIEVMPGKPTALGVVDGKPVFGLPGYPVSAAVAAERVLRPWVERWLGTHLAVRRQVQGVLGRKIVSRPGNEEVVRVVAGRVGAAIRVAPLSRGAGVISSLARASGLITIPPTTEGFEAGAEVSIDLLRPLEEIESAVVVVGSHDLLIDLCADLLRRDDPVRSIVSSHVGSLGGLTALARGECHLAGSHLFDPDTQTYTVPYVHEHLPGVAVRVVHLAMRRQGLIVRAGNPLGLTTWADLVRSDVTFVNRQRGAGTRVILDVRLGERGIDPGSIRGYVREEPTHMAVAAAVAGGVADVGLGIEAAAARLGLGFVPLEDEPFDLVVAEAHLEHPGVKALLALIGTETFRQEAARWPGYDPSASGQVKYRTDDRG